MKNPAHPGRIIKGSIDELELSVQQAADAMEIAKNTLYRIIRGENGVTADMAVRLEAVIGSTADQWLRLQNAYDLAQVRNTEGHPAQTMKRITASPVKADPPRLV